MIRLRILMNRLFNRTLRIVFLAVFLVAALCLPPFSFPPSVSYAGNEGVYLDDAVYFTLEDAALSSGSESQSLRFTLLLVNDSDRVVDYNNYGVRIVDSAGNSFAAQLSEKAVARVQPHQSQEFKYMSQIASQDALEGLKVSIFAWDSGEEDFMRDIGELSLATATNSAQVEKQQVVLNLGPLDATLPDDALVAFELVRSHIVLKDGGLYMSIDLLAENMGSTSFKLPANLALQLKDGSGRAYNAAIVYGGDKTLLPNHPDLMTVQAMISEQFDDRSFSLQYFQKSQNVLTPIGSIHLTGSLSRFRVGDTIEFQSRYNEGLKLTLDNISYTERADGVVVEVAATVRNGGPQTVIVPGLTAQLQLKTAGIAVSAADATAHPDYLPPGDSTIYRFRGTLPQGTAVTSAELVIMEKKSTAPALSTPMAVVSLEGAVSTTNGVLGSDPRATLISTSVGALNMRVIRTQQLHTDGDDVLLSEIELRNVSGGIVSLPALYGGYRSNDADAEIEGKVVRLQSSPLLGPYQQTVVYLYAIVPYGYELSEGELFLGEGTIQTQGQGQNRTETFNKTMEWARLPFQVDRSAIPEVDPEDEWSVDDAGRKSSVSVIGSSIYDVGKQKMIAVRLLQSGRELRNGNIVPYVGFFQGPDGSIWPARTTEEEGRLCQGCLAMSTLWFTLPEVKSFATTDYKLWFGEKLDDQAFAHVRQYNVPPTGTTPVLESVPSIEGVRGYSLYTDTKIGPVDLYPYQVAFNRIYITVADNSNKYQIEFDYSMGKMSDVAAGGKNRGLKMVLKDNREKVMKSWNFPLEGNGALAEGTNKLTVDLTGMDLSHMVPPRLYVYETFEGGERLIGSNVRLVTGSVIYDDAEAEDSGE